MWRGKRYDLTYHATDTVVVVNEDDIVRGDVGHTTNGNTVKSIKLDQAALAFLASLGDSEFQKFHKGKARKRARFD